MIFEQEYIIFEILDVLFFDQKNSRTNNSGRNFDALSMRFEADTIIETETSRQHFSDNVICYAPAKLNYTRIAKKDVLIAINFKVLNYQSTEFEHFVPKDADKYRKLFEELLYLWNAKRHGYKSECSAILNKIFAQCYKDNPPENAHGKLYHGVQYIEKNLLSKDFSLAVAAEKSFMSETYFRKLFNKDFGISPKRFVIESRMKYAQALILTNYFSLQEVSERCGYNDYKHFSSEFKKFTGLSPSRYSYEQKSTIQSEEML